MFRSLSFMLALALLVSTTAFANNETDTLIQQGYQQAAAGKLDEALATLQQAVDQDPESSLAYTRLGGVQILRQEYTEGIKSFQQAIMLDGNNSSAFVGMAVAYLHNGKYNLARAALQEAEQLDPQKKPEIDKLLAWIDQRTNTAAASAH